MTQEEYDEEPIAILHVDAHSLQVRLPSGHEFGIAFYPPKRGDPTERVVVTHLDTQKTGLDPRC